MTPQPHGGERRHHSPAPGAPGEGFSHQRQHRSSSCGWPVAAGDNFVSKQQRSNSGVGWSGAANDSLGTKQPRSITSGGFPGVANDSLVSKQQHSRSGWPENISGTSIANLTSRVSTDHHTEDEFIKHVCNMVDSSPPDEKADHMQHGSPKDHKMTRNMLMIQQQRYQELQETHHSVATGSPGDPPQSMALSLPAKFNGPLMPLPPGFDGNVPLHGVENGGTVNISKTVNFTYHSSFQPPPLSCPRPMYPYPPSYGGNFQQSHFNPIQRPRMQGKYGDRSHSRNANFTQVCAILVPL